MKRTVYTCPKKAILASDTGFAEFKAERTFVIPTWFRVYGGLNNRFWLVWWLKEKKWRQFPQPLSYEELVKFSDALHYIPVKTIEEAPQIPLPPYCIEVVD